MTGESSAPHVLVIEDDKRLLRALSYFLRQKGMIVHEATDGDAGLDAWREHRPDVLIVDNSLPHKMGYEVCREIRRDDGLGQSMPIIMISAFMKVLGVDGAATEDDDLIDDFLRKPFQLEQLWSVIERMHTADGFTRPPRQDVASSGTLTTADLFDEDSAQIPAEGSCAKIPFIELLARALRHQTTGILTLREANRVRRLYLANGFPAFARSNLITENLLRYLLRIGEIDAETYRRHLSRMQQERWRPGATLVREGTISLTRLNRAHRLLVEEIIQICTNWSAARFEFKASQVPVEQAVVYDINPFRLLDRWLERHFSAAQLVDRIEPLLHGRIEPTPRLSGWRHLLEWGWALDPELETSLAAGAPVVQLLDVDTEQRPLRARMLQTLLMLGAVTLTDPDARLVRSPPVTVRRLMRPADASSSDDSSSGVRADFSSPRLPPVRRNADTSSPGEPAASRASGNAADPATTSLGPAAASRRADADSSAGAAESRVEPRVESRTTGEDAEGRTQAQLRRIYDVVLRDYRRVLDGSSPFEILRVSRNDGLEVIRRRYERFERFYRPENFQRLGDSKLFRLAIDIRQALARAMAEIEANGGSSPGMAPVNPDASFGRGMSVFDASETQDALAQIFFNDGVTYLRISDFDEAHAHFTRAVGRERANGMFQAYLIWSVFLRAGRSADAAGEARTHLESLIESHPDEDAAYHFLAHIHREEGNLELAVTYYRRAAELNPDNRSARLFLQRLSS